MKCLSLLQPWASLCVTTDPKTGKAYKQIETRSWNTKYRGPLLIHASKKAVRISDSSLYDHMKKCGLFGKEKLFPYGAIIGMVNLVATFKMGAVWGMIQQNMKISIGGREVDFSEQEITFGDYSSQKRYGWLLSDPILFKTPIPCKGNLSIWNLPVELEDHVQEQINAATKQYHPTAIATPGEGAVIVEPAEVSQKTIGQLLTDAFTLNELKAEVVENELGFPAGMITSLMNDNYYTNSVPVVLFKNLILSLHIRPSDVYKAMIPTFNAVHAKETPENIKKKPHGYQLWENKEAVKKYTAHLKELIEAPVGKQNQSTGLTLPANSTDMLMDALRKSEIN